MEALLNIMFHSAGNMLLGVLVTIAGVCLIFFLVRSWCRAGNFTPVSFITGIILFLLLSFQATLLCGAVTVKAYRGDVETAINGMVAGLPADTEFNQQDSQQILDAISARWPLVSYYVDLADFRGHTPGTIGKAMSDELNRYMDWFILRRVCWSLFFVLAGTFTIVKTMGKGIGRKQAFQKRAPLATRRIYDD